jgi:hypothetical protein
MRKVVSLPFHGYSSAGLLSRLLLCHALLAPSHTSHPIFCSVHCCHFIYSLMLMSNLNPPTTTGPKKGCICQLSHRYCDPITCSDAPTSCLGIGEFSCSWSELKDNAATGCRTFQAVPDGVAACEDDTPDDDQNLTAAAHVDVSRQRDKLHIKSFSAAGMREFEFRQTSPPGEYVS